MADVHNGRIGEIEKIIISPEYDKSLSGKIWNFWVIIADCCSTQGFGCNLVPKEKVSSLEKQLRNMYELSDDDDINQLIGTKVALYGGFEKITMIENPDNKKSMKCEYKNVRDVLTNILG